jgi:hypothetical protein
MGIRHTMSIDDFPANIEDVVVWKLREWDVVAE